MMRREELNPGGCEFLGMGGEADLHRLEGLLLDGRGEDLGEHGVNGVNRVAAIFTEFPSNPLMKCPDLIR